jgi:hypothetical protein
MALQRAQVASILRRVVVGESSFKPKCFLGCSFFLFI